MHCRPPRCVPLNRTRNGLPPASYWFHEAWSESLISVNLGSGEGLAWTCATLRQCGWCHRRVHDLLSAEIFWAALILFYIHSILSNFSLGSSSQWFNTRIVVPQVLYLRVPLAHQALIWHTEAGSWHIAVCWHTTISRHIVSLIVFSGWRLIIVPTIFHAHVRDFERTLWVPSEFSNLAHHT